MVSYEIALNLIAMNIRVDNSKEFCDFCSERRHRPFRE